MKTMAISEFKAKALKVLNELYLDRGELIITRRGRPLVRIQAYSEPDGIRGTQGQLADTCVFEEDIVNPVAVEDWGVLS